MPEKFEKDQILVLSLKFGEKCQSKFKKDPWRRFVVVLVVVVEAFFLVIIIPNLVQGLGLHPQLVLGCGNNQAFHSGFFKYSMNTPWTKVGPGSHNRTLAVKICFGLGKSENMNVTTENQILICKKVIDIQYHS